MSSPWVIVTGDFSNEGGMDRANYQLAWYLADTLGRAVHLVAHRVCQPLAGHPRVVVHLVPRPLRSHSLGAFWLNRAGRCLARRLTRPPHAARVLVNGGNCDWTDFNWVHMVHHAQSCQDEGAPLTFRVRNRLQLALARRRERQILSRSQLLLVNSRRTQQDVVEKVRVEAARVQLVYLGVDPGEFRPLSLADRQAARRAFGLAEDAPVAVFVGALGYDRRKGFDTLLTACRQFQDGGRPLCLLAAGQGALSFWQSQIDRLGLGAKVRLLGQVKQVTPLLAAGDVLVSPSRYEPYGLNVHEALCCGVPAIVSRCAGVAERYPPSLADLLLEDPDNPQELARRMETFFRQPELYRSGVAEAGRQLRGYTWTDMAAHMVALIEEHAWSKSAPRRGALLPGRDGTET